VEYLTDFQHLGYQSIPITKVSNENWHQKAVQCVLPDSFPCAARECSHDAPASRCGTQACPPWVTTWHVV